MLNEMKSGFLSGKTKIMTILFFVISFTSFLFSQPVEEWMNTNGQYPYVISSNRGIILEVDDRGNSYVMGINYNGGYNIFTVKYDINGNLLWSNDNNLGNWITQSFCMKLYGGYLYESYTYNSTLITKKYDADGNLIWTVNYNYVGIAYPMAITSDRSGNVYIASTGETFTNTTDFEIIKYDQQGNQVWFAYYNGPGNYFEEPGDIKVDRAGNVYVTGTSWGGDSTQSDYATIKINVNGVTEWVQRYNSQYNQAELPTCLELGVSGIYVTGLSWRNNNKPEFATIKYDNNGNQLWEQRYNHSNEWHRALGLAIDHSENVYVTGGDYNKIAVIKYNTNGIVQWVNTRDGEAGYGITLDDRQDVYVTGNVNVNNGITDGITIKYDRFGNQLWEAFYDRGFSNNDRPVRIKTNSHCDVYVAGFSQDSAGVFENFILKYNECSIHSPLVLINSSVIPNSFNLYQNYPNPFNPSTKIKFDIPANSSGKVSLRVYDLIGREVSTLLDQDIQPGTHEVEFDGSNFSSGIYFYKLVSDNYVETRKMILTK
ncbi:MAG TPA: SBBP repeat-containing protein [Ignavibacteria bacterium]|jgi:hypothetical protein